MYELAPFLALALFIPQPGQEWPGKGDRVYVAARFADLEKSSADMGVRGYILKSNIEPCAEIVVEEADAKKSRWNVKESF